MKKGIGAGINIERKKGLPETSLQQIKYVGETYEAKFKRMAPRIKNTTELIAFGRRSSATVINALLKKIFNRKSGGLDRRAYNSTLMFLYRNGNSKIPKCIEIDEL
jgi:hypothetical protein